MPTGTYDHPLLGPVEFKTKSDKWVRGDKITFTSGFDPTRALGIVYIPQLKDVKGANGGRIEFHKQAHGQLKAVFEEIERKGLLGQVTAFGGGFNPRLRKPTNGSLSKLPSNHSFGLAVDVNPDDGSNGGTAAPLAPVFKSHGFRWGQDFDDPMHFEVTEFQPSLVAEPAVTEFALRGMPASGADLNELSAFIAEQAKLFPGGLHAMEVQWTPGAAFSVRLEGRERAS